MEVNINMDVLRLVSEIEAHLNQIVDHFFPLFVDLLNLPVFVAHTVNLIFETVMHGSFA
jgi:hypothetical protein